MQMQRSTGIGKCIGGFTVGTTNANLTWPNPAYPNPMHGIISSENFILTSSILNSTILPNLSP